MKRHGSLRVSSVCSSFLAISRNERTIYFQSRLGGGTNKNRRRRQSILVAIDNGPIKLRIPVKRAAQREISTRSAETPLTSIFLRSIESTGGRARLKNARVFHASSLPRVCPYRFSRFLRQRIVRSRKILISRLASVGFMKPSSVSFFTVAGARSSRATPSFDVQRCCFVDTARASFSESRMKLERRRTQM